ncbi:MAG: YebC/PmpR family DNA-binding transcriptional regulator [Microgenomates group bacterium]
MSGHSKWANIKNRKGAQDKKRSVAFTKISKNILMTLRTGGNVKAVVEKAKEANMPKENIDRLIERFESRKANVVNYLFEGYGPSGVPVMVEVESDNKNRILGEVRLIFKNYGGNLGEEGSVGFLFNRVGEVEVSELKEEDELTLIDAGATEFEDKIIYTVVNNLKKLTDKIGEMGGEVIESKIVMKPLSPVVLTEEKQLNEIMEMVEELEENEDVIAVFAGFDFHE